jgi:hypothetical protein
MTMLLPASDRRVTYLAVATVAESVQINPRRSRFQLIWQLRPRAAEHRLQGESTRPAHIDEPARVPGPVQSTPDTAATRSSRLLD